MVPAATSSSPMERIAARMVREFSRRSPRGSTYLAHSDRPTDLLRKQARRVSDGAAPAGGIRIKRVDHTPAGGDDRTGPIAGKARSDILHAATLGAEAGNQEDLLGHELAQSGSFLGFGCPDHCAQSAIPTPADRRLPPYRRNHSSHRLRDGLAGNQPLGLHGVTARIRRAH